MTNKIFHSVALFSINIMLAFPSLILLSTTQALADNWYVATTGVAANTGAPASPWDLKTALNGGNGKIKPGDTVWLKGGLYDIGYKVSTYNNLEGTSEKPITIRQMPGERATIMGAIYQENKGWIIYRDFEIMHSYENRTSNQKLASDPSDRASNRPAMAMYAPNVKLINLVIHDACGNGVYVSQIAPNVEVYGCLIYNNGWQGPGNGYAHGLYSKNNAGNNRYANNILFNGFGHGLHLYDETHDAIQNYTLEGNVVFNSGLDNHNSLSRNMLIGGDDGVLAKNCTIKDNYSYYPQVTEADTFNLGGYEGSRKTGSSNNTVTGNYFVGGYIRITPPYTKLQFSGNTIYGKVAGFTAAEFASNTYQTTRPSTNTIVVRPNQYDPDRATIIIYNWQNLNDVTIHLPAGLLNQGDSYELRNVQDYFSDILKKTYDGSGSISIPMTGHTIAAPVGWKAAPTTFPDFGVFVLINTGSKATPER